MIFLLKEWTSVASLKARLRLATMAPWLHHGLQRSPEPKWTPAPVPQRGQEIANLSKSGLFQPGERIIEQEQRWIDSTQYSTSSTTTKLRITSTTKSCHFNQQASVFFRNQCGCIKGRIYRYCSGSLPKAI